MVFKILFSFILSIVLTLYAAMPSFAQSSADQVLTTTFDEMPPYRKAGFVPDIGEEVGYNTEREWRAGDRPADVVKLGDVETGLGVEALSLSQISELTGLDLAQLKIENLDFLRGVSIEEFLMDVPFLSEWNVSDIPELEQLEGFEGIFTGDRTLGEVVAQTPEIASLEVTDVFGEMPVGSIPNLESAQLSDFEGIGDKSISEVPGLGSVSLDSFPIPVSMPSLNLFPKQDIAFGPKEYSSSKSTPQPVSGGTNGTQLWRPMACKGGCAHIELAESGWEGANWMTKDHRVPDGFGFLGSIIDEAGAYRIPFGPAFALQVVSTDEKTGEADWGLAFRVCKRGVIDLGCTAYFMEVPLGVTTKEGDNILTGVRDGLGGSTVPMKAPPEFEAMRPETPSELQTQIDAKLPPSNSGASLCGEGPGNVNLKPLAEAFHDIESAIPGDPYGAVGVWVDGTPYGYPNERGFALGRYQYMSYREDVIAKVSDTSGGKAMLDRAFSRQKPTPNEVLQYFPPDIQDSLFVADQSSNIEALLSKGFEGERLLEVLGQVHFGGFDILSNGSLDSGGTDANGKSLRSYGQDFKNAYRKRNAEYEENSENSTCGKTTGKYRNPTAKGWKPHQFFNPAKGYNPKNGMARKHLGIDLGGNTGESIVAADGGVISVVAFDYNPATGKGWGNYIVIDHGGEETLYAHLDSSDVQQGASVEKGQHIGKLGSTGGSSGPHLHFEVIVKGKGSIDPEPVTDFNEF